jgi:apolipoprotein N-acyltransferase
VIPRIGADPRISKFTSRFRKIAFDLSPCKAQKPPKLKLPAMIGNMKTWLQMLGGAVATGVLLALALPLGEQGYLAFVALVPLLLATRDRGFILGFLGGILAISTLAIIATSGAFYKERVAEGNVSWIYTSCGLFGFSFSVFFALWGDAKLNKRSIFWLAAVAVLLESVLLVQIPAHLALTQYRNPLQLTIASVGGIWLVSWLVWLANLSLATHGKNWKRSAWVPVMVLVGVVWTFASKPQMPTEESALMVGLIQVETENENSLLEAQEELPKETDFAVWPEFGGILFVRDGKPDRLVEVAEATTIPIITSFPDNAQPLPHNVASLVTATGESERYEKRRLFGGEKNMHTPGTKPVAVKSEFTAGSIGLNICFDSCYPWIIRETAALPGVSFIALPTIDPPSPHYFLSAMHAAYTPFRSAENGISMVRVDGHYGSMVTSSSGQILKELKGSDVPTTASFLPERRFTVYQKLGDWFLYLMILWFLTEPFVLRLRPSVATGGVVPVSPDKQA